MRARILLTGDTNPYANLAREEALLLSGAADATLFLWQNQNTVVIGMGQNAWSECRTALLAEEGGLLARRTTGGGAVFHDLGNLNFSFIVPREAYDLSRQLSVVQNAVRSFGIDCAFSGRNDLEVSGRKFSGNAFRFTKDGALHHGTLLVSADMEKLSRYLQVSPQKLSTRGVQSTRSRVCNLADFAPVTIEALSEAMREAFQAEYGPAETEDTSVRTPPEGMRGLMERNASWDWNYGATPSFDASFAYRFAWGGVELQLTLRKGRIETCRAFTDAMDADLSKRLEKTLTGCAFTARDMGECAGGDIGEWLAGLSL